MKQYYNVGASLPFLDPDQEFFPSTDEFIETCRPWLTEEHLLLLENITHVHQETPAAEFAADVLPDFASFERRIRAALAVHRSQRLEREHASGEVPDTAYDSESEKAVAEALAQPNPLAMEETLDTARWHKLDELQVGHYFDIQFLTVYALKLLLLERKSRFTQQRGIENFTVSYRAVWTDIEHHVPKTESGANV
ncbi:MAG: DUF2764 family protein [Spirochaeta sp.]